MKKAPGHGPGAFWLCAKGGRSPPPFHTFPPLPVQRVFSFFDTLKPPDYVRGLFLLFMGENGR